MYTVAFTTNTPRFSNGRVWTPLPLFPLPRQLQRQRWKDSQSRDLFKTLKYSSDTGEIKTSHPHRAHNITPHTSVRVRCEYFGIQSLLKMFSVKTLTESEIFPKVTFPGSIWSHNSHLNVYEFMLYSYWRWGNTATAVIGLDSFNITWIFKSLAILSPLQNYNLP